MGSSEKPRRFQHVPFTFQTFLATKMSNKTSLSSSNLMVDNFLQTWTRWWFQIFFIFHPYLGKWSNLTSIFFQMGWFTNHQLVKDAFSYPSSWVPKSPMSTPVLWWRRRIVVRWNWCTRIFWVPTLETYRWNPGENGGFNKSPFEKFEEIPGNEKKTAWAV